jgi:predicted nucleic acid-binding protein
MRLVIDNSVVMRWLFKDGSEEDLAYAASIAKVVETFEVHVPALFIAEAANVIFRALKAGVISQTECDLSFDLINQMQAVIASPQSTAQLQSLAKKAFEENLSAYDASYLLLAQSLQCPLATLDKDLKRAAINAGVSIVEA